MTLSEISIRRPVFATVMSMMLVLLGVVSFSKLSVREYPRIDEPVVTVGFVDPTLKALRPKSSNPRSPSRWKIPSPASMASTS